LFKHVNTVGAPGAPTTKELKKEGCVCKLRNGRTYQSWQFFWLCCTNCSALHMMPSKVGATGPKYVGMEEYKRPRQQPCSNALLSQF
jgi:hypothetical protein